MKYILALIASFGIASMAIAATQPAQPASAPVVKASDVKKPVAKKAVKPSKSVKVAKKTKTAKK